MTEVAGILGVSRQRVYQLAHDYPDFPAPVAMLASGRVWDRAAIEAWTEGHPDRRPGRRRRTPEGGQPHRPDEGGGG